MPTILLRPGEPVITPHGEGRVDKIERDKVWVREPQSPWPFPEVFVLKRKEVQLIEPPEAPF